MSPGGSPARRPGVTVRVPLSPSERARLEVYADAAGLTLATLARTALLEYAENPEEVSVRAVDELTSYTGRYLASDALTVHVPPALVARLRLAASRGVARRFPEQVRLALVGFVAKQDARDRARQRRP